MGTLKSGSQAKIKKQLKSVEDSDKVVAVPLPRREKERVGMIKKYVHNTLWRIFFFLTVKNHEISEIECVCFLSVSEMLIFNFDFSNSPSSLKCREDKDIS